MEITWGAIGKLVLAGVATYVLLPAFMILRDYLLWKFIGSYILNKDLHIAIQKYVFLANQWNSDYAGNRSFDPDDFKNFASYLENSKVARNALQKQKLFIDRKSVFLNYLIKHYKQDEVNPINSWIKQAQEDFERQNEKSS